MSGCCNPTQCQGIEQTFNPRLVRRDLENYRRRGPDTTTRALLEAIAAQGEVAGALVLDIGGGVGAIQHALLADGAARAVSVDASAAYLAAAREEAERRGHADRLTQVHGNFVTAAPGLEDADIVTLDRVICCYDDMPALVSTSAARARRLYGAVYPRDTALLRAVMALQHAIARLTGWKMQFFAHRTAQVDALVQSLGLRPVFYRRMGFWQVVLYAR